MTEAGAVTSGDLAQTNPKLGAKTQKRKKIEETGSKIETSTDDGHNHFFVVGDGETVNGGLSIKKSSPGKKNGHIHSVYISSGQLKSLKNGNRLTVTTSKDDGHTHSVSFDPETLKNKLGEKNMDTIQETDGYKFYNSGDRKIFEFKKSEDFANIQLGFKKRNFRYFRESQAGTDMLETLQSHKGKNFVVKCGNHEWRPFSLGF